jgi:hypothetical protein
MNDTDEQSVHEGSVSQRGSRPIADEGAFKHFFILSESGRCNRDRAGITGKQAGAGWLGNRDG